MAYFCSKRCGSTYRITDQTSFFPTWFIYIYIYIWTLYHYIQLAFNLANASIQWTCTLRKITRERRHRLFQRSVHTRTKSSSVFITSCYWQQLQFGHFDIVLESSQDGDTASCKKELNTFLSTYVFNMFMKKTVNVTNVESLLLYF